MNKNHLLPALLFVLAACGGTTSSSAPASSITLDTNEYRFIGGQANIGSWTPANAPVMTRATGTNSFSWTGDLYEDSTWKLVIGTDWANGEVGPLSAGLTITDKGVAWTKDAEGALVIPEDSNSGFDPGLGGVGNFKTLVDGNYTVTFVSLPALTRTFTIVRNGDPEVLPPSITDWALVGTINGWNPGDMTFKLNNRDDENTYYSLTLNLFENEQFKFVKNGAWGGDLGFAALNSPNETNLIDAGGDIKVVRDGSFSIIFESENEKPATVVRLGDVTELTGGIHLVGTIQDNPDTTETNEGWDPANTSFALTFDGGLYISKFDLPLNAQLKVKFGRTWQDGYDAGFSKLTSMPENSFADDSGNIKVLVAGNYRFVVRVIGESLSVKISHSWLTYGGMSAIETKAGSVISYVNSPANFWESGALVKFDGTDETKTAFKVEFTGVLDTEYLFKFEKQGGNNAPGTFVEFSYIGTGEAQTAELSLAALTTAEKAELNLLVVFVKTAETTGEITISNYYYA
jgi:hypothetical protein